MKILVDAETKVPLTVPCHLVAIGGLRDASNAGLQFHPTVSELIPTMLGELKPLA